MQTSLENILEESTTLKKATASTDEPIWLIPDKQGNIPLHHAAQDGKMEICQLLLNRMGGYSQINHCNKRLKTPLYYAFIAKIFNPELIAMLINHGADY